MASEADNRMAAFVARGYLVGTLADRSMLLLTAKGAPVGSISDRQNKLGKPIDPRGHIDPTKYP